MRIPLRLIRQQLPGIQHRLIMSSASRRRAEEAVDELKKNPYYEKYADKIAQLQETSPEEFLSRVEERQESKQTPKLASNLSGISNDQRNYSSLLAPRAPLNEPTTHAESLDLDKIMKIDLIKDLEAKEIERIWQAYHVNKDFISAAVPTDVYDRICTKSKLFPTFLFPVPRNNGYEFIVCQFAGNIVHFTPLLYFQVHKENAPECLTITHYTEFQKEKEIVLMRGEFDKNVLNAQEAQCLANQLQLYYSQDSPIRTRLMETFTHRPDEFKHMELIKNIENLSL